jgi:hypothetical protein
MVIQLIITVGLIALSVLLWATFFKMKKHEKSAQEN